MRWLTDQFPDVRKLAEHWATREDLPAMLQLGVIAPPGRRAG